MFGKEVFCKKDVLKDYKKRTGKHLRWNSFIRKVATPGLQLTEIITSRQVFPVNYVQIFTTVICQTTPVDGCFCSFKKNYVTPTNSLIAKDKISIDFLRKHLMQFMQ